MFEGFTVAVGAGMGVSVTVAVSRQPLLFPITMYVVVVVGRAFTLAPVVALSPDDGLQLYKGAPLAVRASGWLEQTLADVGETVTVGYAFTKTVTVEFAVQPFTSVPTTM